MLHVTFRGLQICPQHRQRDMYSQRCFRGRSISFRYTVATGVEDEIDKRDVM